MTQQIKVVSAWNLLAYKATAFGCMSKAAGQGEIQKVLACAEHGRTGSYKVILKGFSKGEDFSWSKQRRAAPTGGQGIDRIEAAH
jgi:hypothetical protein